VTLAFFIDSVPFTADVIHGRASLGGSESACLGLARALKARGHEVHIFTTQLDGSCVGRDDYGLVWHHAEDLYGMSAYVEWDTLCALRMPLVFAQRVHARLRVLWNQDLLIGEAAKMQTMSLAWAYDKIVYVSEYHRKQWEGVLPELKPIGWVTKNGYDPAQVPTDVVKHPSRIIHITRPERGLSPLLQMWPKLLELVPDAELHLCRYNSMYDAGGWGKICAQYDEMVAAVNQQVGGITYLGELGKADLYRAIAEAAVMWYPGVVDFAETSCCAAVESQACGTPFVGSFKGALPETVPYGVLFSGDATSPEYQTASVQAVASMLRDCRRNAVAYRELQKAGREHVKAYTYDVIAEEWEQWIGQTFTERYLDNKPSVLERLLHEDDHTAALRVADSLVRLEDLALCDRVIAGKEHTSEDYSTYALPDPIAEWDMCPRFHAVAPNFETCTRVLDVACGNGAFAIGLARQYPHLHILGLDYSEGNIARAVAGAETAGVSDRVTFGQMPVWDFSQQCFEEDVRDLVSKHEPFDGMFAGEFLEHIADAPGLIDSLESLVADGATIVYTVPHGPFDEIRGRGEPRKRSHVHHFQHDDLTEVFGQKRQLSCTYFNLGLSLRGTQLGHWLIRYTATVDGPKARPRPYEARIASTRPFPKLSVGIIAKNAGLDLARCLESVWHLADEIIVGDTGSTDNTVEVAESYGARVLRLTPIEDDPDGFSGARNAVLRAATGEWFLWIDADEVLMGGPEIGKYLESSLYHGYAIKQTHVSVQDPPHSDKPVRLFRRLPSIQFAGCVHEQPVMGDVNGDIMPALELHDVVIAHFGYLADGVVRHKLFNRNLPLLVKDQQRFPDRRLGKLLVLRDYINLGDHERARHDGELNAQAKQYYARAVGLFEKEWLGRFDDKYYGLARPFYERALEHVAGTYEFDLGIAGRMHTMANGRAKTQRVRVRKLEDIDAIWQHQLDAIHQKARPPIVDVDPVDAPNGLRFREGATLLQVVSPEPTPMEAA
jgi:glycosyltransferase involved in cell wall biosynthesis/SAM-dependent methyltransferase